MKKYITYVIGGLLLTFQLLLSSCNNSKLEALKLSHSELNLLVGKDQRLEVIHIPIEATPNNRVSWKSSDRRVATVSNSGLVTAVYSGTCVITAYCGEIEVKCTINVSPISYQLELVQGIGYIFGDEYGIGGNHLLVRLLDKDLNYAPSGEIEGNGFFLNLEMDASFGNPVLKPGVYPQASTPTLGHFIQGSVVQQDGNYYATGSYLGYYGDQGLSAIFINNGEVNVAHDGERYTITINTTGDDAESIRATFNGNIGFEDRSTSNETEVMNFQVDTCHIFNYGDRDQVGLNVVRLQLFNPSGDMLRLDSYVPLSIRDTLPVGTYTLSNYNAVPYRLIPADAATLDGCWINDNNLMTAIKSGRLRIERDAENNINYAFTLYDINGRLIESKVKEESVRLLRIK